MSREQTTAVVQRYLDRLAHLPPGDAPAEPIVRELLAGAVNRLQLLCSSMLFRHYPRLRRPPLNLQPDEMLGAVTERMLKAMRAARPQTVRQFFAMANQHVRWELNDVARRLDKQAPVAEVRESFVAAPGDSGSSGPGGISSSSTGSSTGSSSGSGSQSASATRILEAIANLPDDEREALDLVRIQGMTQAEAAEVLGVALRTVQRRLNRALVLLAEALPEHRPASQDA